MSIKRMRRGRNSKGLFSLVRYVDISNGVMAEVGSYMGESTLIFAKSQKFDKIYAIDPWADGTWENPDLPQIEAKFDHNISKRTDTIVKVKKTSLDAAKDFQDKSLDMVYIDACHDYDSVKADIIAWTRKVKPTGYIAGHDYFWKKYGVKDAVKDTLGEPVMIFKDSSWLFPMSAVPVIPQ